MRAVSCVQSEARRLRASTRNWVPPMRARTSFFPKATDSAARHGLQRGIAGVVAQTVVQLLHVVHVGEEDLDLAHLRVGELQESAAGDDEAAPVLEAGELVAAGQLDQARAELFHLPLYGGATRDVVKDAADPGGAVVVAEPDRGHLEVDHPAVAAAQPRHAHGGPGPVPFGDPELPTGVLLVEQALVPEPADLVGGPAEHGAGGGAGGDDAAVRQGEEHPLGAVLEHDPVCAGPGLLGRYGVLHHHSRSSTSPRTCTAGTCSVLAIVPKLCWENGDRTDEVTIGSLEFDPLRAEKSGGPTSVCRSVPERPSTCAPSAPQWDFRP